MSNPNGSVVFCGECGFALTAADAFCINCGTQVREVSPIVGTTTIPDIDSRSNPFAKVDPSKIAADAKANVVDFSTNTWTGAKNVSKAWASWVKDQKRWLAPLGATLGLALLYLTTQQVITAVMGPEPKLQAYVSAIKTGNFEALSDESLFPGSSGQAPAEFRQAWTADGVNNAHPRVLERNGLNASAAIYLASDESGKSYAVNLVGEEKWVFGFRIIEWSVTTPAPKAKLAVAKRLYGGQTVVFGKDPAPVAISAVRTKVAKELTGSYSVLPGVYTTTTSAAGFLTRSTRETQIWSSNSFETLLVDSENPVLSAGVISSATKNAVAANRACAKAKCKGMPRYKETDFNLWSQYTYDTYTYSVFSSTYSGGACTNTSLTVIAYNKINLDFSCDITVKANLYVRYVYYSGYYSDYWYYWNFKDSKTSTTYPSVTFTANSDASEIAQRGVRW